MSLVGLDMPKKCGRAVLAKSKSVARHRSIPVDVLTTSRAEKESARTDGLGVNSFIKKPVTFDGLVQAMHALGRYWFEIVDLPS